MNKNQENESLQEVENPSLIGMINQPKEQFRRIKANPKILFPLIIITILTIVAALLTISSMEPDLEGLQEFSEGELLVIEIMTNIATVITSMIAPALVILISAAIYFIIAKASGKNVSFKQMFSLITHITFISTIGSLLNGILAFIFSGNLTEMSYTSLNVFFAADGAAGVLLGSIEVFSIWVIILTAIGLQKVANFTKTLAWSVVIGINILLVFLAILLVMLEQALI